MPEAGGAAAGHVAAHPAEVRVWDPLVRIFHWSLVAAFATAWLSAEESGHVHRLAGYVVLGLVVERLTGKPFAEAARERIFAPAGMSASGWLARDALPADAAIGYTREGWQGEREAPGPAPAGSRPKTPLPPRHSNALALPAIGSSAGGSYSTARDLLAFTRALATHRVAGPERFAQQGGLGIAGGTAGANAVLEADFEAGGWTVIVLENLDPPAAEALSRELRALLDRIGPEAGAAR